jgi:hypothetical protein
VLAIGVPLVSGSGAFDQVIVCSSQLFDPRHSAAPKSFVLPGRQRNSAWVTVA